MEQVTISKERLLKLEALEQEENKKQAALKRKADRETYSRLVDETVHEAIPILQSLSDGLHETKDSVLHMFDSILSLKEDISKIKPGQRSHKFTSSDGKKRITIGYNTKDDYSDLAEDGILMVKNYISSLARDEKTKSLVDAVLKLLSKDDSGNLKASRVLQLQQMAEASDDDNFKEGVRIINEAYQPAISKQYIRAEFKDERNVWNTIPLSVTDTPTVNCNFKVKEAPNEK